MENRKYLFISFYYSKKNWHLLVRNLLAELMLEIRSYDSHSNGIIHLSSERGENIGLTLSVAEDAALQIASLIHTRSNFFFRKYPSAKNRQEYFSGKFFKDFPANSIHYNLHDFPFPSINGFEKELLRWPFYHISEMISDVLCNDEIDDESIFTFSFYLHMLLIRSLSDESVSLTELLQDEISSPGIDQPESLEENMPILYEITETIMDGTLIREQDNLWMEHWVNACRDIFRNDHIGSSSETNPLLFYKKISSIIKKQLGFSSAAEKMLSSFIWHCLAKKVGLQVT